MRLGVAWDEGQNAQYRAFQPMRAMVRRGHEVVWPPDEKGAAHLPRLLDCDVVHVFRRSDPFTQRVLAELMRRGIPFSYDIDDDFDDRRTLAKQQRYRAMTRIARAAHTFTTTNEVLAGKYRAAGVPRVKVIGNYLVPDIIRPRMPHEGVVIGWIAGTEHRVDAKRLDIAGALRRVLAAHPHVRVECIGVDLHLPERYRYDEHVDFEEVPDRIGGWDVGIAPLVDTALNRARSDIKVKEYAASRTTWLASPIGPYTGLGPNQGGLLTPDDGWFKTLDRVVRDPGLRERLGENGGRWARTQTMDAVADEWESTFLAMSGTHRIGALPGRPQLSVKIRSPR